MRRWVGLVAGVCWLGLAMFGQDAGGARKVSAEGAVPAAPTFEVASIKPSRLDAQNSNLNLNRGHVTTENMELQFVLQFAYALSSGSADQIVGAPGWVRSARFDIDAKEEEGLAKRIEAMPSDERTEVLRGMMQRLLADRFQLKVHRETRQLPVDAMEVARGGARMKQTAAAVSGETGNWSGLRHDGPGHIEGRGATMEMLASMLAMLPEVGGRLVVDRTGLPGRYDFVVQWTPDEGAGGAVAGVESGPSLFGAMSEQLGLKVESRKAPVQVLVIDRVEKPTEN